MDREKEEELIEAMKEVGRHVRKDRQIAGENGQKVELGLQGEVDRGIGITVGGILGWQR